jgi:tetratricopeptide (TPR) repeat protein
MSRYRSEIIIGFLLVMMTFAVYQQVRNYGFMNYDDDDYVTQNPFVRDGLTWRGVSWAFRSHLHGHYHPVTWLSHMTDTELFGLNPAGHHLTSVFLHIINTLLLFLILRRMTGDLWQSAFVGALFAIHPLHVEPIAWIAGRKDVLCAFFWMLTMWGYVRYAEHPGLGRYLVVLVAFTLGLMSKTTVVTLPFVLLLLDYWPLGRLKLGEVGTEMSKAEPISLHSLYKQRLLRRLIREKAPLFIIAGFVVIVIVSTRQTYFDEKKAEEYGDALPQLEAKYGHKKSDYFYFAVSYAKSFGRALWPHNLATPYTRKDKVSFGLVVGGMLLLLGVSSLVFWKGRRYPYLPVGWFWYVVTLLPVVRLLPFGPYNTADRYLYLPNIGLFIMVAWVIPDLFARWRYRRLVLGLSAGALLLSLAVLAWFQVRYWTDSLTLFQHAVEVTDNNWLAHNNLGAALEKQGRTDEAIVHYAEAARLRPFAARLHNNLGAALAKQGRIEEARECFSEAVQTNPDYADGHNNLGVMYFEQGRIEEALFHFSEALRIDPRNADAHKNMGIALVRQGKINEAIGHFREALKIRPNYAAVHNNLGAALAKQGRIEEATRHFSEALRIRRNAGEKRSP